MGIGDDDRSKEEARPTKLKSNVSVLASARETGLNSKSTIASFPISKVPEQKQSGQSEESDGGGGIVERSS